MITGATNVLEVNEATIMQMVEEYLNNRFINDDDEVNVIGVEETSRGLGNKAFRIKLQAKRESK